MRSCYAASWRLYGNCLEELTEGRYCFAPPGTPHYPAFHNLGSKNWTRGEWTDVDGLGEDKSGRQQWYNGQAPEPYPLAFDAGLSDLQAGLQMPMLWLPSPIIVGGGTWQCDPDARPVVPSFQGFPLACYGGAVPNWPIFDLADVYSWRYCAEIVQEIYNNPGNAGAMLASFLPVGATIAVETGIGRSLPGTVIGRTAFGTVLLMSGTDNFKTFALQILSDRLTLANVGPFATSRFWWNAVSEMAVRLKGAGYDPTEPLLLCGHSYGGAVALLLAAAAKHFGTVRDLSILTFGSPKPGNAGVREILTGLQQVHCVNEGDPVPKVPFPLLDLGAVFNMPELSYWHRLANFESPDNQAMIAADGGITWNGELISSWSILLQIANWAAFGTPLPALTEHDIGTYVTRLRVAAP